MSGAGLFAASVAVYSAVPLLLAVRRTPMQFHLLYAHIAAVLTLGGLLGAVYVLPLGGDVSLLAGQVSYGGFMFSTLVTVIVGRDVQVVRNIVFLTVTVDLVIFMIFKITHLALAEHRVPDPYGVDPRVFDQSLRVVVLGGVLIITELLALLGVLEWAKARLRRLSLAPVYVLGFVGILTLDGVLFPVLVLQPSSGLGALIGHSVPAKLVLAAAFAVPLTVFLALYPRLVQRFESTPLHLVELVPLRRREVLSRLQEQEAELEVRTAEATRATAIVERILDAATNTLLVATDPEYRITHFNTGAQELLGFSPEEVVGRSMGRYSDVEELERHAERLGVPADLGRVVRELAHERARRDWSLRTKSGEKRVVSISLTEIRDDDEIVGYLLAGEDITGRVRTEEALSEALRREVESVARLEEADRLKDEVVSTVSHELRTPISSILGYAELLAEGAFGEMSDRQVEALAKILRNTAQLSSLVSDLLALDRANAGGLMLAREPVDLAAVVTDAVDAVEQMRAGRDLSLSVTVPREPVTVLGDAHALERVVLNLAANACKFTPDGGSVDIALATADHRAVLSVADTGIGIPHNELDQVRERFFRSSRAYRHAVPGIGLGLTIVDTIVAEHGGTVAVESTIDVGTTVTVSIPLDRS